MKKLIILYSILVLTACASKKGYESFDYSNGSNPWVNAFKDKVFTACLRESYRNDTIFLLIEKEDLFKSIRWLLY